MTPELVDAAAAALVIAVIFLALVLGLLALLPRRDEP